MSRLQTVPAQKLFLTNGKDQESVHLERRNGCPAGSRETDHTDSIPTEMISPALSARMK